MTFSTTPAPAAEPAPPPVNSGAASGAGEFYWVAGLSLVNTVLTMTQTNVRFPVGLGITQVVDSFALAFHDKLGNLAWAVALGFGLLAAAILVLLGWLSGRGSKIVLVIGTILYGLDGVLCLLFQDWFSVAFHAFILFKLIMAIKNFD